MPAAVYFEGVTEGILFPSVDPQQPSLTFSIRDDDSPAHAPLPGKEPDAEVFGRLRINPPLGQVGMAMVDALGAKTKRLVRGRTSIALPTNRGRPDSEIARLMALGIEFWGFRPHNVLKFAF